MSDYISRADAIDAVMKHKMPFTIQQEVAREIDALPSADAVHGEWRIGNTYRDGISRRLVTRLECSNCNSIVHRLVGEQFPDFCQNCGARMKGGDSE